MKDITIAEKVAFLRKPEAYAQGTRCVDTRQTHMSWVFLTEIHAWKLKKPVRSEYFDFSTPEARRRNCEQEVLLNRRLSANVYIDVVPLTATAGRLRIGGSGNPVDWLVQMRRLPDERMLDRTIADLTWTDEDLRKVGTLLGEFYRSSPSAENSAPRYCRRLSNEFLESGRELQQPQYGLPADLVNALLDEGAEYMERKRSMLEDRVRAGKIVDAHGDLRAEHICLERRPVIIDCLEFNASLRMLDSASELAFLKLECERLGAIEVGNQITQTCCQETGDWPDAALMHFYKIHHACIRAKLALWHLRDAPDNLHKWVERAITYLRLAARQT